MQKRLVRKLDLELLLSRIEPNPAPKANLEQYTIPADVAATMLYLAAYSDDNITGKSVLDLGCGTGRLALGAAFLGAKRVVGVDVDKTAVNLARANSLGMRLKKKVQWITGDIAAVRGRFDTVLQNPPYGVQTRGADRAFLDKALELGNSIYSLHKSLHAETSFVRGLKNAQDRILPTTPSPFLKNFIERHGGVIKVVFATTMTIPHMFNFHREKKHEFVVDLYVVKRKSPFQ